MKKYKSLLAFLFICLSSVFMAQNKEMEAEAEKNFESKNFEKAYELYDKLYSQSPKTYDYKGSQIISGDNYLCKKMVTEKSFIEAVFPTELLEYFEITYYQVLCSIKEKLEYWLIDFQERNELPNGLSFKNMRPRILLMRN